MNLNRPDMTETVKSENYTKKFLQKDSNPTTMWSLKPMPSSLRLTARQPRSWCTRWKRSHECWPSACALLTTCATAPPSSVSCGQAEASASRKTASMRGSTGQLDKEANLWHISRNAAAPMVSAILTKTSRVKTATNGKVFLQKRRQQIAKNKSNMNLQTERF